MYSKNENLNTIAKITLILSDTAYKEGEDSNFDRLIISFETVFELHCDDEVYLNFLTYRKNFNPFLDMEYLYEDGVCTIRDKRGDHNFLVLPDIYVDNFIPFLKEKHPELYDIVWLNWTNPEYDVKFDWNIS